MNLKIFDLHYPTQFTYVKLVEHLMDYYDENPKDLLNDTRYLEKIESKTNNYINSYVICDDIDFN